MNDTRTQPHVDVYSPYSSGWKRISQLDASNPTFTGNAWHFLTKPHVKDCGRYKPRKRNVTTL